VHQVEIDLQEDELRRSRLEMEAALARQIQLYEHAPVGYFTIDGRTAVHEVNRAGARLLGFEREFLLGENLASFLLPSTRALDEMLQRVAADGSRAVGDLQMRSQNGTVHAVRAALQPDPAGDRFLMAVMAEGGDTARAGLSRS
jgi:PAS domain S-box-containing protein